MEVTNDEYMEAAQNSMRRLSRLCDYQEQHIAELERQLREARTVIETLQEESK